MQGEADYKELVQELLVDIMIRFKSESSFVLKSKTKSWDLFNFSNSKLNYKLDVSSNESLSLKYLIDSYNRAGNSQNQKSYESNKQVVQPIVQECKFQIINNVIILLKSVYSNPN